MASIIRSSPIHRPSCSLQYLRKTQIRCFSISQPLEVQAQAVAGSMMKNMPRQQSLSARMKKLKKSDIPNDVGLIPQLYIRPCGKMPSWFSQPTTRLRLEWLYVKQGVLDFGRSVYLNRWNQGKDPITGRNKKIPLDLRDRHVNARDLHKRLYTALAALDRATVAKVSCSGLANQQLARIDKLRMSGADDIKPWTWTVKYRGLTLSSRLFWTVQSLIPSYFKAVHVIADRESQLPVGPGMALRQVVLRVDSTQTLDKNDGSAPVTKKMREYVVLQRTIIEGEDDGWKIWGTTEPTATADAQTIIESTRNESGTLMDRVRTAMPGLMNMGQR